MPASWSIAHDTPPVRVLVVDDELLIRWSVAESLSDHGFAVSEADDGRSAIRVLTAEPPDVVLLDFRMPDSEDLRLLAKIRELVPQSQVILMTAFGSSDVIAGALNLGAYQVVSKPFDVNELAALVQQAHAARAC
jgi:two-component system, NtrC family, response regulator AtoC